MGALQGWCGYQYLFLRLPEGATMLCWRESNHIQVAERWFTVWKLLCLLLFRIFTPQNRVHWTALQCKWTINPLNSTIQTAGQATLSCVTFPLGAWCLMTRLQNWPWDVRLKKILSFLEWWLVGREPLYSALFTAVGSEADQRKRGPVTYTNSCPTSQIFILRQATAWLAKKELRHCPTSLSFCLESQVQICHNYTQTQIILNTKFYM